MMKKIKPPPTTLLKGPSFLNYTSATDFHKDLGIAYKGLDKYSMTDKKVKDFFKKCLDIMSKNTSPQFMKEICEEFINPKFVDNEFLRTSTDELKKLMD